MLLRLLLKRSNALHTVFVDAATFSCSSLRIYISWEGIFIARTCWLNVTGDEWQQQRHLVPALATAVSCDVWCVWCGLWCVDCGMWRMYDMWRHFHSWILFVALLQYELITIKCYSIDDPFHAYDSWVYHLDTVYRTVAQSRGMGE